MKYEQLSDFTKGYIDAIFFTDAGPDNPEFDGLGFYGFAPKTLSKIIEDCAGFQMNNKGLLEKANDASEAGYTDEQAGHDLWLTRNRHGAGFWDRGLHNVGEELTDKAHAMRELSLVLGDDGKLYLEG